MRVTQTVGCGTERLDQSGDGLLGLVELVLRDTAGSVKDKHDVSVGHLVILSLTKYRFPNRIGDGVDNWIADWIDEWIAALSETSILETRAHSTGGHLRGRESAWLVVAEGRVQIKHELALDSLIWIRWSRRRPWLHLKRWLTQLKFKCENLCSKHEYNQL